MWAMVNLHPNSLNCCDVDVCSHAADVAEWMSAPVAPLNSAYANDDMHP